MTPKSQVFAIIPERAAKNPSENCSPRKSGRLSGRIAVDVTEQGCRNREECERERRVRVSVSQSEQSIKYIVIIIIIIIIIIMIVTIIPTMISIFVIIIYDGSTAAVAVSLFDLDTLNKPIQYDLSDPVHFDQNQTGAQPETFQVHSIVLRHFKTTG